MIARQLRNRIFGAVGALIAALPPLSFAQEKFPSKVVRILTAAPGSNHDWGARVTANALSARWPQRAIVENRGSIAVEIIAKDASSDGHTLLFYGAYVWLQPLLQKVNWEPLADLAPITLAITSPNILVVHPSIPVTSVKELIALARARPGELNYSAGGGGSTQHIAAELFKYLANVRITRVFYKGAGPAIIGMLSGEVHVAFAAVGPIMPHVKQGKVRPLAVSTPKRTALFPELPPVADSLPGFTAEATIGFFAPRKTPAAIIAILNREIVQALKDTDQRVFTNAGVELVGGSPEEFAQFMKAEMARVGKVIKSAAFSS